MEDTIAPEGSARSGCFAGTGAEDQVELPIPSPVVIEYPGGKCGPDNGTSWRILHIQSMEGAEWESVGDLDGLNNEREE